MFFELLDFNGPKPEDDEQIVRGLPLYLEALAAKTITFYAHCCFVLLIGCQHCETLHFFLPVQEEV